MLPPDDSEVGECTRDTRGTPCHAWAHQIPWVCISRLEKRFTLATASTLGPVGLKSFGGGAASSLVLDGLTSHALFLVAMLC